MYPKPLTFMQASIVSKKQFFWHVYVRFSQCLRYNTLKPYFKRKVMNTTIELIQQKLQDVSNQVDLLQQQFDGFLPVFENDENLSTLVASLQSDVGNFKTQVSNMQSNIDSLSNTYANIVNNVENNATNIQELENANSKIEQQLTNINTEINTINANHSSLSSKVEQNSENIKTIHIQEAIQYRSLDKKYEI